MEKITIFTPSYNRAHTLGRTYESLLKQSNKNFIWLIIDDGSSDNTMELVEGWVKNNNGFIINYVYKDNGGMHTAHNIAYELINTELNVCIDSDDCLADDAINKILNFWEKYGNEKYAGIIGLDATFDGIIIGNGFKKNKTSTTLTNYYKEGGKGDMKLVYRTDIMKNLPPYPVFEGERYVALAYKYLLCDQNYELLVLNEVLCNVEYQLDGSSNNMYRQYIINPKGFAFWRKISMQYSSSFRRLLIDNIHYVSSSFISKNKKFISESPNKILTILMIPLGLIEKKYIYWRVK